MCVIELGIPSSVDLVCSEPAHMVTAFSNGRTGIFNMETQQLVLELESQNAGEPGTYIHTHTHACTCAKADELLILNPLGSALNFCA